MSNLKKRGEQNPLLSPSGELEAPYQLFARVYDRTMLEVPYLHWAGFIFGVFDSFGLHQESMIADLGCGTGIMIEKLRDYYPHLFGIDISPAMLQKAAAKGGDYLRADLVELPLANDALEALFSLHDTLNYLESDERLDAHFKEIFRVLIPGGIYIFDLSTEYNAIYRYHEKTFVEQHDELRMVWSNRYDFQNKVITSEISFYDESAGGRWGRLWRRLRKRPGPRVSKELHRQTIFSHESVCELLEKNGLHLHDVVADYGEEIEPQKAHLLVYIVQKQEHF